MTQRAGSVDAARGTGEMWKADGFEEAVSECSFVSPSRLGSEGGFSTSSPGLGLSSPASLALLSRLKRPVL